MKKRRKQSLASSFQHAFEGIGHVLINERNARIHGVIAILTVALGLWLRLEPLQWIGIVVAIALVFVGEMLNTVVELVIDLIVTDHNDHAKHAKDVAAGAILINAIAAVIIGLIILGPALLKKLAS